MLNKYAYPLNKKRKKETRYRGNNWKNNLAENSISEVVPKY
jgi:hypothetical protein